MAPKKSQESGLASSDFITGARLVVDDMKAKPYSRTVVDWLEACGLLELCTFSASQLSLQLTNDFHNNMKVTRGTGKLQGSFRGHEVQISARSLSRVFDLPHTDSTEIWLSDEDLDEAWKIMRPGKPMIGSNYIRKEFSREIYLLSDVVDKVLMCKTGNKDKFTDKQLRLTGAILLRRDMNWANLLLNHLKTSVLSVAQQNTSKRKFVRVINYYMGATYPNMLISVTECIAHTASKDINNITLKFLEKIVGKSSAHH